MTYLLYYIIYIVFTCTGVIRVLISPNKTSWPERLDGSQCTLRKTPRHTKLGLLWKDINYRMHLNSYFPNFTIQLLYLFIFDWRTRLWKGAVVIIHPSRDRQWDNFLTSVGILNKSSCCSGRTTYSHGMGIYKHPLNISWCYCNIKPDNLFLRSWKN